MPTSGQSQPNVVVFMTDQQRGSTVLPGHRLKAFTPRLDELRADGVTFTHAYSVSPHCCPSRTSFFTGRYPSEHGVWNNVNVANALSRGPREGIRFWSEDLSKAGYQLGFAGKWHVSNTTNPADYGWDECLVTAPGAGPAAVSFDQQRRDSRSREIAKLATAPGTTDEKRPEAEIIRPGYPRYRHYGVNEDPFNDAAVVQSAIDFLRDRDNAGEPWFLYVGTLGPHDPYEVPQRFLDLYDPSEIELPDNFSDPMIDKPALYRRTRDRFDQLTEAEHREAIRHYLAFCSYEDELFGRVWNAVADAGQLANTILVYASDHGDYVGDHGLWCKGLPAFDAALHIPTVIGGPGLAGVANGRQVTTPVSIVDLGPTLLELCGTEPAAPMSGHSLVDVINGDDRPVHDELIFQSNGNEAYGIQRVIRTDRWKLVVNYFDYDELYDLERDPDELTNLLHRDPRRQVGARPTAEVPDELSDIVEDLYQRLWRFSLDHDDDLTNAYIMTALASYGPGVAARQSKAADEPEPADLRQRD